MDIMNNEDVKNLQSYTWFLGKSAEKIKNIKLLITNSKLNDKDGQEILYKIEELLLTVIELTKKIFDLSYTFLFDIYYLKSKNDTYNKILSGYLDNFLFLYSSVLDLIIKKIRDNLFSTSDYDSYGKLLGQLTQNRLSKDELIVFKHLIDFKESINEVLDPRHFSMHNGVIELKPSIEDKGDFTSPLVSYYFNKIHKESNQKYTKDKDWFVSILGFPRLKIFQLLILIEWTLQGINK